MKVSQPGGRPFCLGFAMRLRAEAISITRGQWEMLRRKVKMMPGAGRLQT